MSDIPNTTWDPLIQNREVTSQEVEQDYRAEEGKAIESMSSEQEKIKKIKSYNAELKADVGRLQQQNVFTEAEFE